MFDVCDETYGIRVFGISDAPILSASEYFASRPHPVSATDAAMATVRIAENILFMAYMIRVPKPFCVADLS